MSGRRPSQASDALYHIVPQSPALATTTFPKPAIALDGDSEELAGELDTPIPPRVDTRIRWIHFVLGCAVLLPWNVLITATPYFLSRLEGSSLQNTFSSYLSFVFTGPSVVFLAHATATAKQRSPARRVLLSTLTLAFLTLLLTLSTFVRLLPGFFFSFILLNAFAQAGAGSYLQTSVVGVASLFGHSAVQALMSGQAAVAVVVSGVQVLSAATSLWGAPREGQQVSADRNAEEDSAFLFFGLSTVFLLVTAGAHTWLTTMPAYKAIMHKSGEDIVDSVAEERQGLVFGGDGRTASPGEDRSRIWRVAKANAIYEVAVSYVFVVTLAVFPSITTAIQSTNPGSHPLLFSAIHFLLFNIGDFTGRLSCSYPPLLIWSANKILAISLSRTLFIPLFLMCNIQRNPGTPSPTPPTINSDTMFFLILLAFGWTNGWVSSLCMMAAPSLEHNPRLKGRREDVDVAATVASFCLISGLAVGSLASFGVRAIFCGCNPFMM